MRRMYSEKELTTIINQVVGEYIEAGALDESIADAVDAYLLEHPVDITALEGQTINPARINVANINGETNPSVKPIYYHPILIVDNTVGQFTRLQCALLDNQSSAYNSTTFVAKVKS